MQIKSMLRFEDQDFIIHLVLIESVHIIWTLYLKAMVAKLRPALISSGYSCLEHLYLMSLYQKSYQAKRIRLKQVIAVMSLLQTILVIYNIKPCFNFSIEN